MDTLIQKWIIYSPIREGFFIGTPFSWVPCPNLARIYSNYSDAIMAVNSLDAQLQAHPVELKFHFNTKTLKLKKEC